MYGFFSFGGFTNFHFSEAWAYSPCLYREKPVPITLHCGITPIFSCNQVELDEMYMSTKFGTINVTKFHILLPQYSLSLTLLRVWLGQASVSPFRGINPLHVNFMF